MEKAPLCYLHIKRDANGERNQWQTIVFLMHSFFWFCKMSAIE